MLVVSRDELGHVRVDRYEREPITLRQEEPILAIGSGAEVALGAMYSGASAPRAVEIANQLLSDCGRGIETLTFED